MVNQTKKKRKTGTPDRCMNTDSASHVVAQILALAFSSSRITTVLGQSMIVELLKFIVKTLQKSSSMDSSLVEEILSDGFLAALPLLLQCSCPGLVSLWSAEILGAAALWSYEINVKVACDKEIITALVLMIRNQNKNISEAACNALMDLATTSVGREKLRESGAIEQLLILLCQVSHSLCQGNPEDAEQKHLSISSGIDSGFQLEGNEFLMLILDAITILVFYDNGNHMALVPKDLTFVTLSSMQELWATLQNLNQKQMQNLNCKYEDRLSVISGKSCSIVKMIFRLAIEQVTPDCLTYFLDTVKKSIFGDADSCFEHFARHHWECCPMLIRKKLKRECDNDIISLLIEATQKQNVDDMLDQILTGVISCPPVTADNLDVLDFLREIQDGLGHPMVYDRDIRIIKSVTEEINGEFFKIIPGTKEQHFFEEFNHTVKAEVTKFVSVQDCKQAYKMGYTIAIRGMEFRSRKVAEVADALAMMFGQASVGANLYLTPPSSQGLSAHYDDHCVLVCQLAGNKRWVIFPPEKLLPRLYEPLSVVHNAHDDATGVKEIGLKEGDILYIPRGFPHAAHTITGDCGQHYNQMADKSKIFNVCLCGSGPSPGNTVVKANMSEQTSGFDDFCTSQAGCINTSSFCICHEAIGLETSQNSADEPVRDGYSLHLTFGIEVEPPFEWEGIIHIALHCWEQQQKLEDLILNFSSEKIFYIAVQMLHIAVRKLGDSCPLLRKACTVVAPSWYYNKRKKEGEVEFGLDTNSDTASAGCLEKDLSSEEVFLSLIGLVRNNCNFADAYRIIEVNLSNLDCDPFQWMKWLRHLSPGDTNSSNKDGWNDPSEHLREMFQQGQLNELNFERAFLQVKSRFSNEVKFEGAYKGFQFLLEKYRHARKQFINGMLALHSGSSRN